MSLTACSKIFSGSSAFETGQSRSHRHIRRLAFKLISTRLMRRSSTQALHTQRASLCHTLQCVPMAFMYERNTLLTRPKMFASTATAPRATRGVLLAASCSFLPARAHLWRPQIPCRADREQRTLRYQLDALQSSSTAVCTCEVSLAPHTMHRSITHHQRMLNLHAAAAAASGARHARSTPHAVQIGCAPDGSRLVRRCVRAVAACS